MHQYASTSEFPEFPKSISGGKSASGDCHGCFADRRESPIITITTKNGLNHDYHRLPPTFVQGLTFMAQHGRVSSTALSAPIHYLAFNPRMAIQSSSSPPRVHAADTPFRCS